MIQSILHFTPSRAEEIPKDGVQAALSSEGFVWADVVKPSTEDEAFLRSTLGIHEMALDDMLQHNLRPKVEDFPGCCSLLVRAFAGDSRRVPWQFIGINLYTGPHYLVTVRKHPTPLLDELLQEARAKPERYAKGPVYVLYRLINALLNSYLDALDELDDKLDELEDEIFASSNQGSMERLFTYKRNVINLRKVIQPTRELLNSLTMGSVEFFGRKHQLHFRDLYNHAVRVNDAIESDRDLLTSLLDAYLSTVSNKMNEVMKTLTVIATIMMPLTLITGIYGMNFQFMPELTHPLGYAGSWAAMLLVAVLMLLWFRRKGWW